MAKRGIQFGNPSFMIDRSTMAFGSKNSLQPSPGGNAGTPIGLLLALTKAA